MNPFKSLYVDLSNQDSVIYNIKKNTTNLCAASVTSSNSIKVYDLDTYGLVYNWEDAQDSTVTDFVWGTGFILFVLREECLREGRGVL
eukprot:TRINITY_DN1558_c0_g1_i6.p1 TRINITY_DN1558_c0_g1~~TRINITY_DN1558_c0_g1_i6.p1  ORF type:complete len:102 (-),score=25.35 TRINITY_DN1558_c0_g1_i6:74-337(-)